MQKAVTLIHIPILIYLVILIHSLIPPVMFSLFTRSSHNIDPYEHFLYSFSVTYYFQGSFEQF